MFGDDQSSNRMVVPLAAFDLRKHVETRPPSRKFGAYGAEALHQLQKIRITSVTSVIDTESCQYVWCARANPLL